jgi:hypothetical protein
MQVATNLMNSVNPQMQIVIDMIRADEAQKLLASVRQATLKQAEEDGSLASEMQKAMEAEATQLVEAGAASGTSSTFNN